jgi:hypothetical protein
VRGDIDAFRQIQAAQRTIPQEPYSRQAYDHRELLGMQYYLRESGDGTVRARKSRT